MNPDTDFRPDWWSKTLAGCLPGFVIALTLTGLFAWLGPGGIDASDKVQFNMWAIAPLWMTLLGLVYLFRTGWQAWLWLGGISLLLTSCLIGTRWWLGGF